jgi:hypothetical protein
MMEAARRGRAGDAGPAVVVVAFSGLFHMGELTATEGGLGPVGDLGEADATFYPNPWNATKV